jgi:hypothetical protein
MAGLVKRVIIAVEIEVFPPDIGRKSTTLAYTL